MQSTCKYSIKMKLSFWIGVRSINVIKRDGEIITIVTIKSNLLRIEKYYWKLHLEKHESLVNQINAIQKDKEILI